jgi:hypothetical protein
MQLKNIKNVNKLTCKYNPKIDRDHINLRENHTFQCLEIFINCICLKWTLVYCKFREGNINNLPPTKYINVIVIFPTKLNIFVHLSWAGFEITTIVVICTDCIRSYKSNYHTITTIPNVYKIAIIWKIKCEN